MSNQSIWSKLDRFPPVLVRLLAKHPNGRAMTDAEIAARSGLFISIVKQLSYETSWEEVPVGDMQRFVQACRVDFADREQMRNANRYRDKDPKFFHLTRDKNFPVFREMLNVYLESQIS